MKKRVLSMPLVVSMAVTLAQGVENPQKMLKRKSTVQRKNRQHTKKLLRKVF